MEKLLYEITLGGTLYYLIFWFSDNPAAVEGCDACIGYQVYDGNKTPGDGGELDYNMEEKSYNGLEDALEDIVDFAFDGRTPEKTTVSALDPDDFED